MTPILAINSVQWTSTYLRCLCHYSKPWITMNYSALRSFFETKTTTRKEGRGFQSKSPRGVSGVQSTRYAVLKHRTLLSASRTVITSAGTLWAVECTEEVSADPHTHKNHDSRSMHWKVAPPHACMLHVYECVVGICTCSGYMLSPSIPTDEVGALVFDVGSYSTRAGYAGEDTPKVSDYDRYTV